MNKIRHFAVGLLLFSVIIALFLGGYNDLIDTYNWTEGDLQNVNVSDSTQSGNIAEQFNRMLIIESTSTISSSIYDLKNPTGSAFDIAGALLSVGIGVLGTIVGIIIFPFEIGFIIASFYGGDVPGVITGVLIQGVVIYIGFILLSAKLRHDV